MIAAACYRRQQGNSAWRCIPDIPAPIRRNLSTGDIECMSNDGQNCINKCPDTTPVCPENPVTCGCNMLRTLGTSGYTDPSHWCNKCDIYLKANRYW